MNEIEVISLSGKAAAGKDFLFNNYLRPLGYHRFALADHFKLFIVGQGSATYEEVFTTKPPHVRKLLQEEGTERGRNVYGEDIWLKTTHAWMQHISNTWGVTKFCIVDARFPNEIEYIQQKMNGKVFRINAPIRVSQSSLTPEARQHISETALDNFTKFDGIIENDPQFAASVKDQIERLLDDDTDSAPEGMFHLFDVTFGQMDGVLDHVNKIFKNMRKD